MSILALSNEVSITLQRCFLVAEEERPRSFNSFDKRMLRIDNFNLSALGSLYSVIKRIDIYRKDLFDWSSEVLCSRLEPRKGEISATHHQSTAFSGPLLQKL